MSQRPRGRLVNQFTPLLRLTALVLSFNLVYYIYSANTNVSPVHLTSTGFYKRSCARFTSDGTVSGSVYDLDEGNEVGLRHITQPSIFSTCTVHSTVQSTTSLV